MPQPSCPAIAVVAPRAAAGLLRRPLYDRPSLSAVPKTQPHAKRNTVEAGKLKDQTMLPTGFGQRPRERRRRAARPLLRRPT